jgi:phospholipid/cholesterol/gamma-HCH transport system ATP-binding protein
MIEVKNLSKSFGQSLIWQDVSFTIEDNTVLAIIGRSGCGKSVLLKHLNALLEPDNGEVLINGENIYSLNYVKLRKVRQLFGVLFQGGALFDSIDTFENVAFPLRYFSEKSESEIRKRVLECLDLVNLSNAGSKNTADLSGGMRKRVGLARAMVLEPRYLLYDEPTSGLDPETSDEINDLIIDTAEKLNVTSVVITHDMHSVLKIADKAIFLDQQKLAWQGTIDEMKVSTNERLLSFIKAAEYTI